MDGSLASASTSQGVARANKDDALSTLALDIVREASKPDVGIQDLAKLGERDPAFAAKLLFVVNSPVNGFSRKVSDIRQASSLLGVAGLRNVALSLCVTDLAPIGGVGETLLGLGLRRATASQRIAEVLGLPQPGDHFTTGLMLEVGLLSLARHDIELAGKVAKTPSQARPTRERTHGLMAHPHRGGQLAQAWHLPEAMALAIAHHHDETPLDRPLAKVAWASERVSAVFEGGLPEALRSRAVDALLRLGMKKEDADLLITELPGRVRDAAASFQRSAGAQIELDKILSDAHARLIELNQHFLEMLMNMERMLEEKEDLLGRLQDANSALERLAATDGLTGLLNRRAFMEAMQRDFSRVQRHGGRLAMVLFDVDHFKKVNDTHGHQAGDEVLRGVSKIAAGSLRTGDVIGRYGGEEFVILLPEAGIDDACLVADRIRQALNVPTYPGATGPFKVSATFGVTMVAKVDKDIEAIIARADAALYKGKEQGRNRVVPS